jgi:hypothetical protein
LNDEQSESTKQRVPPPKTWFDDKSGEVYLETQLLAYKIDTNRNVYVKHKYKELIKQDNGEEGRESDDGEEDGTGEQFKRFTTIPKGYNRWQKESILKATYEKRVENLPDEALQKAKKQSNP